MADIPRGMVDELNGRLDTISLEGRKSLAKALVKIDFDSMKIADARETIISIMDNVVNVYGGASARVSSEFYDTAREKVLGERMGALADSQWDPESTNGYIRYALTEIVNGGSYASLEAKLLDRIDYEIKTASNRCIAHNAIRDPAKGVRYARVPQPTKSYALGCTFCRMLASRGFVYTSRSAAGSINHYHTGCQCRIVPSWGNSGVEGYDPKEFLGDIKAYEKGERAPKQTEDIASSNSGDILSEARTTRAQALGELPPGWDDMTAEAQQAWLNSK